MTLLMGSLVGLLASGVLLVLGLVWGERWLALAAGVAVSAFLGAVALLAGAL